MESNDNLNCLDLAYSVSCALVHRTQFTQYKYSNTLINCWIINLHSGIYVLLFFWRYFSVWTTLFISIFIYAHMHKVYEFFFVILEKKLLTHMLAIYITRYMYFRYNFFFLQCVAMFIWNTQYFPVWFQINAATFALLFSEMVQYCQNRVYSVSELQTK